MISIIIPVYNGEMYIDRCISSIINTNKINEYEIVIINDGSTDNTKKVLQKYKTCNSVKIFDTTNNGVSTARNIGIKNAKGSYLMFCDIDDEYEAETIDKINVILNDKMINFDLLVFNRKDICNSKIICDYKVQSKEIVNEREYFEKIFCNGIHTFSVCNKVYKTEIVEKNQLKFDVKLKYSEDTLFNLEYLLRTKFIKCIDDISYQRYCNTGSAIYKSNDNFYSDNVKIIEKFIQYIDKCSINKEKYIEKSINNLYEHYAIVSLDRLCNKIDGRNAIDRIKKIHEIFRNLNLKKIVINREENIKIKVIKYCYKRNLYILLYFINGALAMVYRKVRKK